MSEGQVQRREGLYGFEFREPDRRRTPQAERTHHEIKQLWQRSHEIINLAARGFKNTQIAEILNLSPCCVSDTLNSELGQYKLSEIRQDRDEEAKKTVEKIRVLTNKAIDTFHEIFDDESGECSLKDKGKVAEVVLLELSGLRAPTRIQSHHVSTVLTAEELETFKRRGIEAARQAGLLIEAETEPDESEEEVPSAVGDNGSGQ